LIPGRPQQFWCEEEHGTLKRWQEYRDYMDDNPLQEWLFSCALLLVLNLTLLRAVSGTTNPGLVLLMVSMAFGPATMNLVRRSSEEQQRAKPIPPRQEMWIGFVSLLALACSILSLGITAIGRRVGLNLSARTGLGLLMLFGFSLVLALAFGYAARHTKPGHWSFVLSTGWLLLIVVTGFILLLRG
jgi:hypothetical protein